MKKRSLACLALIALILCACAPKPPEYVAYVNGDGITREQYIAYCWRFLGEVDPEGTITAEAFTLSLDSEGTTLNRVILESAMEYIIIAEFFSQTARELGIEADDEDIAALAADIAELEQKHGSKELYEAYLKGSGMSAAANREIYLSDILKNKVSRALFENEGPYAPSAQDLEDYFNWNYATISHILLLCADLSTGEPYPEKQQGEALKKAREAISRYNDGEDFFELVREYGEDTALEKTGSMTYTFTYGSLTADLEQAAFALSEGEMAAAPVRTAYGYHVLKRFPLDRSYFEDSRDAVLTDYIQSETRALIERFKQDSVITYTPLFDQIDMSVYF